MSAGAVPAAEARYEAIVRSLVRWPGVSLGSSDPARPNRGFGSSSLRINNKIFAMLDSRGRCVVKLPRDRVESLINAGDGESFDADRGRAMKEWVVLSSTSNVDWLDMAMEAMRFVGKVA
jgi:hypothetical protein